METRLPHRILHMHNPGTAAFIIFMRVPSRGRPGESVHHNYHSVAHALLFCYVQLPNYNEEKLQCIGVLRLSGRGVGEGEGEEVQTTGLAANPSRQASERAFFAYYRPDTVCHILRNVHQINVAAAALPTPPAPLSDCCPRLVLRHVLLQRFMHFFSVCDDVCCFRSKTSATVLSLATPQTQQNMPQCRATFLCPSSRPLSHSHTDAKQKIAKLNISRVFYLACCCCCCGCTCPSRLIVHRESELASDAVRPSTPSQCLTHTDTGGTGSSRLQ